MEFFVVKFIIGLLVLINFLKIVFSAKVLLYFGLNGLKLKIFISKLVHL